MNAIRPLWDTMPLSDTPVKTQTVQKDLFTDIFQSAIDNAVETDEQKTQMQYLLATGQLDNPAEVSVAAYKADVAVSMLISLRNKALDAYNELMRISL